MKPLRILHVLGAMNRGGVETWLMHVLRHIDRQTFQTDFLVHTDQPAAYDSEILALGSRILRCPDPHKPALYAKRFLQIARHIGPFDVLHSHVHHFSGFVMALGRISGIPVRIAHSHSDTEPAESGARLFRRFYLGAMQRLIRMNCTHGFAVSQPAADALFGCEWPQDRRLSVLHCGIDLAPFRVPFDSSELRAELGFSGEDVIFGHVGRFDPVKNQSFFIEVAARILNLEPRAKFLFVGDGPLRQEMDRRAGTLGLKDKVVFAGLRSDIPRLMTGAMDAFLMPSIHEGIPLVLMEAQAAGLPCIVSDVLPEEAIVNPALVSLLPLSAGYLAWANLAVETSARPRIAGSSALAMLETSRFNIGHGIQEMCKTYMSRSQPVRSQPSSAPKVVAN